MKVYIIYLQRFISSRFGYMGPNVSTIGLYASEEAATKKLEEIKTNFLVNGSGFIAEDWKKDNRV